MRLEEMIKDLGEKINNENFCWPSEKCRQEHEQLLGWLQELIGLRFENEVILRRLKHLLESDYISQFDRVDPHTKEYIRDIREADRKVMYLCDQKKPCKEHCEKDHLCKRTSDISHAKNFRLVPNGIYPIAYEEVDELVVKKEETHGEWIEHYDNSDGFIWLTCSRCMFKAYEDDYNFCPNCGADMRGGRE